MNGYIGITSREWFEYLVEHQIHNKINFWRKNTNQFKVLKQGEPFFFLVKNSKGIKTERQVLGCAIFERFETSTVQEAWDKYKDGNGDQTFEGFIARMEKMFKTNLQNEEIGCIILSDFKVFPQPVLLSDIGIDFQNSIVSGKSIGLYEIEKLNSSGFKTRTEIIKELQEMYQVGLTEDDVSFPEGRQVLKQHLVRERNPKLIARVKELYKLKHGTLMCEVCHFDFEKEYGEIGADYIEGHHTKPVSEMQPGEETKVEDIAMVCANCHRMLHRRRPWLTLNELSNLKSLSRNNE
ncbi:MAG: HNH endonuclease [Solibacillus sp.]